MFGFSLGNVGDMEEGMTAGAMHGMIKPGDLSSTQHVHTPKLSHRRIQHPNRSTFLPLGLAYGLLSYNSHVQTAKWQLCISPRIEEPA
jgi:hypothetical protein